MKVSPLGVTVRPLPTTVSGRPPSPGTVIVACAGSYAALATTIVRRPAVLPGARLDEAVGRLHLHGDLGRRQRRAELAHRLRHLRDRLADVARPGRGREEAEPLRSARDREPRLGAHGGGSDGVRPVVRADHAGCLDPLERRLALRELDELLLREVHVHEPFRAAPVREWIEVEADHVRLRDQSRVDPPALGEGRRA